MSAQFVPARIEATILTSSSLVEIYKVGGGVDGRTYIGDWGFRIIQAGTILASGEDLHSSTPKTHQEMAAIALSIHAPARKSARP